MAPAEICRWANHTIRHMEDDSAHSMGLIDAFTASPGMWSRRTAASRKQLLNRKEKLIMRDVLLAQPRVVMGLLFFPRGGSAQVTRSLTHALIEQGWDVTVVSGSLGLPGRPGDARTFFRNLNLHPMDYN